MALTEAYETKTRGRRVKPSARAVAIGRYAIVAHQRGAARRGRPVEEGSEKEREEEDLSIGGHNCTHFVYSLRLPDMKGEGAEKEAAAGNRPEQRVGEGRVEEVEGEEEGEGDLLSAFNIQNEASYIIQVTGMFIGQCLFGEK